MENNYEAIIKEFLDFFKDQQPHLVKTNDPTMIGINFTGGDYYEPHLFQGWYDSKLQKYCIVDHPKDDHFSKPQRYVSTWEEFEEKFLRLFNAIIELGEDPKEINVILDTEYIKTWEYPNK